MRPTTHHQPDQEDGALAVLLGIIPDPRKRPTVTIEESGEILGIGRSSAYAAAKAGEIPTIRVGRRLLVPTAMLLSMLGMSMPSDAA